MSRTSSSGAASSVARRPGVLVSPAAPRTWHQRAMEAVFAPGDAVLSHAAAARLHRLDGFDRYDFVDVLCRKGWWPHPPAGTITHFTPRADRRSRCDRSRLDPRPDGARHADAAGSNGRARTDGAGPRQRAAPRHHLDELREVAIRWKRRGRAGPPTLLMLLDERDGRRLPRSWFQRLAKTGPRADGIRSSTSIPSETSGHPARRARPRRPGARSAIECQIVAMARDARRPASRRPPARRAPNARLGDRRRLVERPRSPRRIIAELHHLLTTRPVCAR